MKTILGITGASGIAFSLDLLDRLKGSTDLVISKWGKELLKREAGLRPEDLKDRVTRLFDDEDLAAPVSSGSNHFDVMVVLPCTASTLNRIACGISDTLLTRAAMVAMKERRRLILCLRETPVSTETLRNAARLSADGAIIMPLCPPFYHNPKDLKGVVEGFNVRLLQAMGIEQPSLWNAESFKTGETEVFRSPEPGLPS